MSIELGGTKWTTWDDVEKELFTPEEIAESDRRVAEMMEHRSGEDKPDLLEYKGFTGTIEHTDGVYHGKVQGIRGLVSYEGNTIEELRQDFEGAVNDYLDLLAEIN